jgi:hypothetical protein
MVTFLRGLALASALTPTPPTISLTISPTPLPTQRPPPTQRLPPTQPPPPTQPLPSLYNPPLPHTHAHAHAHAQYPPNPLPYHILGQPPQPRLLVFLLPEARDPRVELRVVRGHEGCVPVHFITV